MITQQILETADRLPEKIALNFNGVPHSYGWFAERIRSATKYFLDHDVCGDGVAVLATNDLRAFWIWSLALRRLGLTTISISSVDELADLRLSNVRFVVSTSGYCWASLDLRCLQHGYALLEVDMKDAECVRSDATPPFAAGGQILKTSGTTGTLKKILIEAASEDMYADDRASALSFDENIVMNVFRMSPYTGIGYKVPVNVWAKGGRIIMNQEDDMHSSLQVEGATHAFLTPQILAEVLAAPEGAYPRRENMLLFVTGGPLTHAQLDEARRRITPRIINMLATTEVGIVGFTPFDKPEDHRWHRQLPGSVVEVVDDEDQPVGTGVVGRLRIANPAQALYFEEADANERFFRGGWFYPGDLAEAHSDGRIALHGRTTDVINVRGSKIAPALVEGMLSAKFDDRQFCLLSQQDDAGEERYFCIVEGEAPVAERQVLSILGGTLGISDAAVSYVPSMPRTESGKVIRAALQPGLPR